MKTKAIHALFLTWFLAIFTNYCFGNKCSKRVNAEIILAWASQERRKSPGLLNDSALVGDVIPVVSTPLLGGSQCSNPARVTTPTTGLSNSTAVPPFLSTAVAVQQMEMDSTFLCRTPLDAQLKLWSRLRYPSLKWFLDHPCAQHGSLFFLSSRLQMLPFKFPQQNGFCSLF